MQENVFADEWRECLQAHYIHVIRNRDKVTEPSLTVVMHQAGFSDSELAQLRVRATMHVDDVGADFVPDLTVLEDFTPETHDEPQVFAGVDLPDETVDLIIEDTDEENEAPPEPADILDAAPPEIVSTLDEPEDPNAPQQLTLF